MTSVQIPQRKAGAGRAQKRAVTAAEQRTEEPDGDSDGGGGTVPDPPGRGLVTRRHVTPL